MRYGIRTENERIAKSISYNRRTLDNSKADTKMLKNPNWRTTNQKKFKGKSEERFLLKPNLLKDKSIWKERPFRDSPDEIDRYIQGHQVTGDRMIERKENPMEFIDKKNRFISATRDKLWETTLNTSNSIRTGKVDKMMNLEPLNSKYSENKNPEFYKKALIDTKSVDGIPPFKHSHNYRGESLKNVRPVYPKLYPKTALGQIDHVLETGKFVRKIFNYETEGNENNHTYNGKNKFNFFLKKKDSEGKRNLKPVEEVENEKGINMNFKKKGLKEKSTKLTEFNYEHSEAIMESSISDINDGPSKDEKRIEEERKAKEKKEKLLKMKKRISNALLKVKSPLNAVMRFNYLRKKVQLSDEDNIDKMIRKYFKD